jgi:hypothetical protein
MRVDEASGQRWELALELLANGVEPIDMADVRVSRNTHGPTADGRITIEVRSPASPSSHSRPAAEREVARARRVIAQASTDPRFARLLDTNEVAWELIWDYGMGSIRLAAIDDEGRLEWED